MAASRAIPGSANPGNRDAPSRERILEAAEALFAENGFQAVSLRRVTAAAGVNLAAVSYHFGSKGGLVEAVLRRIIAPINAERIRRLDHLESTRNTPTLEDILDAFLRPPLEMEAQAAGRQRRLMQLYGRIHAEADAGVHRSFLEMFAAASRRFAAALKRALPYLDDETIAWRLHFVIGTMAQTCQEPDRVRFLSGGHIRPDAPTTLRHLVPFLAAALRAPAAGKTPTPPPEAAA